MPTSRDESENGIVCGSPIVCLPCQNGKLRHRSGNCGLGAAQMRVTAIILIRPPRPIGVRLIGDIRGGLVADLLGALKAEELALVVRSFNDFTVGNEGKAVAGASFSRISS